MMIRQASRVSTFWVLGVLCAVVAPAVAEPASPAPVELAADGFPAQRIAVDTPREMYATTAAASPYIYLERCAVGCTVMQGINDAVHYSSSIPSNGVSNVTPFENNAGQTGAAADAEWAQVVQCIKEIYSPYNVTISDVKPTGGVGYHMAMIAGNPADIGDRRPGILGVAPLASDCSAIDNVMSFSFANAHPSTTDPTERILNICWTASQESAHALGLDHEYEFANHKSACNDPMTYRIDCGGQKFFRNEIASCGEDKARPCKCGPTQNSHLKVLSVYGVGSPIFGNPTVTLTSPAASGGMLDRSVTAAAGSKRGVARVELFFNGFKWAEVQGAPFGKAGQNNPSDYPILVPTTLPNSIVDVKAVAYDDLGGATDSAVVTVTKGAPCASASTCAKGQKCEAGKCFWDPPMGEIGANCSYDQFCKSGICTGTSDQQICTQSCIPGVTDSCPMGFQCVMQSATAGVCFFNDTGGGCCSVDRSDRGLWGQLGIAAIVLGLVLRRRRR